MTLKWIKDSVVIAIHEMQIQYHGGDAEIRDRNLLESALSRPLNKFQYDNADIGMLAAAYAYGLIKNHPFVDGNKRTSLVVSLLFLAINGFDVTLSQDQLYHLFVGLADGSVSEAELADIFNKDIVPSKL